VSGNTVKGMATLAVGSFVDDGTLPKRDVVATADGGLAATVAQGAPALALWAGLKSIQNLRGESVTVNTCRGGGDFTGAKAASRVLKCRVEGDGGSGFKQGRVTCKEPGGNQFVGHVHITGGKVQGVAPFAAGSGVVASIWKPGSTFVIEQEGCSRPAAGVVEEVVVGLAGKKRRHKFLQGDVIAVKDVDSRWMSDNGRRQHHVVRRRQMVCRCKPSCTVRVQELYSYKDVNHGTVQIIVYNQSDHDGVPPTAKPLPGKGDFTVRFCFEFGIQPTYHSHRPPGPALRAGRDTQHHILVPI
jgi:hypothetical protein